MKLIPVNEPLLNGNEKKYLAECIDSGWISSEGPFVERFESEFARQVDREFAISVSSGTAALDVAVEALGIGPGDEVIVPTFSIISCIHQIVRNGATPVFVDCEPDTWNMDVEQVASCITKRTRAILMVHIYGLPVNVDAILDIADKHGVAVIEDAAEMHGQTYKNKPCGSFGAMSTFSFYPNKHVTTGEGGMICTDDRGLATKCRMLRNLCFDENRRFVHQRLGWNYRMTNLQAALGLAQLERLDEFVARKRKMGAKYLDNLAKIDALNLPVPETTYAKNIYWVFGVVISDCCELSAEDAMRLLAEKGIGTRPFFYPLHLQPALNHVSFGGAGEYSVAERISSKGFYIPSGLGITDQQVEQVSASMIDIF